MLGQTSSPLFSQRSSQKCRRKSLSIAAKSTECISRSCCLRQPVSLVNADWRRQLCYHWRSRQHYILKTSNSFSALIMTELLIIKLPSTNKLAWYPNVWLMGLSSASCYPSSQPLNEISSYGQNFTKNSGKFRLGVGKKDSSLLSSSPLNPHKDIKQAYW